MRLKIIQKSGIAKGVRVIVRADFDIPMHSGRIQDDTRLQAHLPTLRFLIQRGARIRLVAHRGRPGGVTDPALTLAPIVSALRRMISVPVGFVSDPFDPRAYDRYGYAPGVLVFENIRFWSGEEACDRQLARALARWGDVYVNEAFANCHRSHASMVGVARILPCWAGLRLHREVEVLDRARTHPKRPLVAIVGGAKIETKLPLIKKLLKDADAVLVGGALANTLFSRMGQEVGKSAVDDDDTVPRFVLANKKIYLPVDVVAASALARGAHSRVCLMGQVRAGEYIADIGPDTVRLFARHIHTAKTVIWNGPLGFAEIPAYGEGTDGVARAIALAHAFSIVGGGDTIAALRRLGRDKGFDHISTGGGAMLEFLSGKKLPALEVLKK